MKTTKSAQPITGQPTISNAEAGRRYRLWQAQQLIDEYNRIANKTKPSRKKKA
jgi:hypothetical protein